VAVAVLAIQRWSTDAKPSTNVTPPPPANAPTATTEVTRDAFAKVYETAAWGKNSAGQGNSGGGSTLAATVVYRAYLQQFLKEHNIKSVVDAGCGDWEFSSSIDWTGIDYKGYDIVPAVIERNKQLHAKPGVAFFVGNIVEDDLPAADLIISKHVLQHLPNANVSAFLAKQLPKYKHALLTNGVNPATFSATNINIHPGEYRALDLTQPPFNLVAQRPLTYWATDGYMHQVVYVSR
jgi:SAM-dependent methyltransferase